MPELLPYAPGSPGWLAARRAGVGEPVTDEHTNGIGESRTVPKLSPYSRIGMIHGAYAAAYPSAYPIASRAYRYPRLAGSWMYRRGFAYAALSAREVPRG